MRQASQSVWDQFKQAGIPDDLVGTLQEAYTELKERYYLGRHKPAELEGGHLAEIVLRILQWATGGINSKPYTPLGKRLPRFDQEVERLKRCDGKYSKTIRVHIPRVLLSIYDIRNNRGVGHVGGDVNPNLADATLVATAADWVMAELVRIYHGVSLNEAQAIVDGLVERKVPVIQMFGDFPKVLRADLKTPAKTLAILYHFGEKGASSSELARWLRIEESHARLTLRRADEKAFVHYDESLDRGFITRAGIREAENRLALRDLS